ncbi:MAG: adenylate/guanylate cyclase domain-containing protein [Ghiorsea sp.]
MADEKTAKELKKNEHPVVEVAEAAQPINTTIKEALDEDLSVQLIAHGDASLLPQLAAARPASRIDTTPLDLDEIVEGVARVISTTKDHYKCIMFTDLVGSTEYKKRMGHTKGYMRNRIFCDISEQAVERYDGTVVKRLGDGVMAVFEQAIDAVLAAMLIKSSINKDRKKLKKMVGAIDYRIGITCGYVKEIPGPTMDYIGHAMDKGARIQSIAKINQILIDEIVYGLIHTRIRDYSDDITIGSPHNLTLKGVGVSTLYEIAPNDTGLVSSWSYKVKHLFD